MKNFVLILIFLFSTQTFIPSFLLCQNDNNKHLDIDIKVTPEQQAKLDTAVAALLIVQQAGHYVKIICNP
jgi:hypothetical protein